MWGNPKDYRERAKRYFEMASETSDFVLKESLIDYAERWLRMAVELEYAHDRVSQRHQKKREDRSLVSASHFLISSAGRVTAPRTLR